MYGHWMRLMMDLGAAQVAASETIARRMAGMADNCARGRLVGDPELSRMILEKWAAAMEGAMAVPVAMAAIAPDLLQRPHALPGAGAQIVSAAMKPAFGRVRANAKRLRRASGRKGSGRVPG